MNKGAFRGYYHANIKYMKSVVSETVIKGSAKNTYNTIYEMQLCVPSLDTCFWYKTPDTSLLLNKGHVT